MEGKVTSNAPEGMIPVADFAQRKGISADKVVDMIRDGFYVGRKQGDDWYIDRSELDGSSSGSNTVSPSVRLQSPAQSGNASGVVVTDIQMPFLSMVVFMVKWVIASIPALIILSILFAIVFAIFGGILIGMTNSRY